MKIVKYSQPNCVPCNTVDSFLKHLNLSVDEEVNIRDGNNIEKAMEIGIQSTPTLVLFDGNGNVIDRVSGMNHSKIQELFAKRG